MFKKSCLSVIIIINRLMTSILINKQAFSSLQGTYNERENGMPTIDLDFSQKQKTRPKTDRDSNNHSNMNSPCSNTKFSVMKNLSNEATLSLLEKKKMYSMAIREKNMQSNQNGHNQGQFSSALGQNKCEKTRKNSEHFQGSNQPTCGKSTQSRNKSSGDILMISNLSNLNISQASQTENLKDYKPGKVEEKENKVRSGRKTSGIKNNLTNISNKSLSPFLSNQKENKVQKQPSSKTKPRDKRENSKHQLSSETSALEYRFKDSSISLISGVQNFMSPGQRVSQDLSMIEKIDEFSRIESVNDNEREFIEFEEINMKKHSKKPSSLSNQMAKQSKNIFTPETVSISLGPFHVQNETTKELDLLRRQNNTFKKDLSMFRRQNGSLRREIEELKSKYWVILEQLNVVKERNEFLEEREKEQIDIMESMRMKMSQSIDMNSSISLGSGGQSSFALNDRDKDKFEKEVYPSSLGTDDKLREILGTYENNLFEAMNQNKKLQFRNYILQKKLMDSAEIHKKQMAREISVWKERYIKARNQNLKMQDNRSMMLLEMSISQDMSDN